MNNRSRKYNLLTLLIKQAHLNLIVSVVIVIEAYFLNERNGWTLMNKIVNKRFECLRSLKGPKMNIIFLLLEQKMSIHQSSSQMASGTYSMMLSISSGGKLSKAGWILLPEMLEKTVDSNFSMSCPACVDSILKF